jgi:S1-C subfamily serine protease
MKTRLPVLLLTSILAFAACDFDASVRSSDSSESTTAGTSDLSDIDLEQDGNDVPAAGAVPRVVEAALPSVVNVRVKNLGSNPITGEFEEGRGEGSGVIVDPEGVIVTNNHVIEGAVEVNVVFNDGRDPLEGQVIGAVPENDLAVIKVQADDLDAIELGKSDNLELGESVVAMGFPLGLGGPTVTQGIISGLERTITVPDPSGEPKSLEGLLQTDAAINPGNSGGALVDMASRLVGINTAAAQASSAENIGFAISIDEAVPIVEEILEDPPEKIAWMGVSMASIESASTATQLGLDPDLRGALVMGVVPESPAEDANLSEGDLIVSLNGEPIESADDVSGVLRDLDPGETVEVGFIRPPGDEVQSVELELGTRPIVFDTGRD